MKNILDKLKTVNISQLKKEEKHELQIEICKRILEIKLGTTQIHFSLPPEEREKDGKKFYIRNKNANARCPAFVAKKFCSHFQQNEKKERRRHDVKQIFTEAFDVTEDWAKFKSLVPAIYRSLMERMNFISINCIDEIMVIPPHSKGSPSYNKKMRSHLIDVAKIFYQFFPQVVLITLTADPVKLDKDIIKAHQQFQKEVQSYCKALVRKYGGKFIYVFEEQKQGTPHAHIEFFCNKDFAYHNKHYDFKKKRVYINKGELVEFTAQHWTLGHPDFEPATGHNVIYYLVKYISKATEADFWKLANKKDISSTDFKEMMGFVMPKLCNYRSVNCSRLSKEMKSILDEKLKNLEIARLAKKQKREQIEEIKEKHTRFRPLNSYVASKVILSKALPRTQPAPLTESVDSEISRLRLYSIQLGTNWNSPCMRLAFSGEFSKLAEAYGTDFNEINHKSLEEKEIILNSATPLTCGGCVFSYLWYDIINGTNKTFEQVDNFEQLKYLFVENLEPRQVNHLVKNPVLCESLNDTDYFEYMFEKIGRYLSSFCRKRNYINEKGIKCNGLQEFDKSLSLQEWQALLYQRKEVASLFLPPEADFASERFFKAKETLIGVGIKPIWKDSVLEQVLNNFVDWARENIAPPLKIS